MREVGSDRVLNAPCFRNKRETSSSPLIRDLAFNRGYREVNLVQISKVNYYRLPWDNIQPSKEVSFLTECMGICCVLIYCTVTVLSKQCVNVVSVSVNYANLFLLRCKENLHNI